MSNMFNYEKAVARNAGYVSAQTQGKIRGTTLLIAGCGIGSSVAVCAARMGFEKFILVDGDIVGEHNLNRQFYDFADIGKLKVDALKEKILRINPQASVDAMGFYLDANNTEAIVKRADIIFDTIDFLDLPAILCLHNATKKHQKHIFTALNVGFGALVWYFAPQSSLSLSSILAPDIEALKSGEAMPAYADVFEAFLRRLAPHLDRDVVEHVSQVVVKMKDGIPCPASQVAVGSFGVGALALSMMCDLLAGNPIVSAPKMVIHSFKNQQTKIVEV
jgi:molybdopterin/thiamine biosynthesis adenylyltransferase